MFMRLFATVVLVNLRMRREALHYMLNEEKVPLHLLPYAATWAVVDTLSKDDLERWERRISKEIEDFESRIEKKPKKG